jgi:hypothetical protein
MQVSAVGRTDVPAIDMPPRFKHDVAYFMTPPGDRDAPKLPPGEYWIDLADARQWLADGVFQVYSPLDSTKQAEIEISAEQEEWLEWLLANQVSHIRVE